jgi:large subunit ribosomal protein L32
MAHPKRKTSKARRDKRRTHDKIAPPIINPPHQAVWEDGNLYYRGALIIEKKSTQETK